MNVLIIGEWPNYSAIQKNPYYPYEDHKYFNIPSEVDQLHIRDNDLANSRVSGISIGNNFTIDRISEPNIKPKNI